MNQNFMKHLSVEPDAEQHTTFADDCKLACQIVVTFLIVIGGISAGAHFLRWLGVV